MPILAPALTLEDLRARARRRLPRMVFEFIDGGAEDESTIAENRRGFGDLTFRPRVLVDVSRRSQEVTVLGQHLSMPV
ncbi:MAG: alpha-hydroxy-acid oxidizing protein, partial [Nocardioides sp.]